MSLLQKIADIEDEEYVAQLWSKESLMSRSKCLKLRLNLMSGAVSHYLDEWIRWIYEKRTASFCNYMTVMWDSKIRGDIQQLWSDVLLHLESFGYDFLPNVKILAKELKVFGRYLKRVNWVKILKIVVVKVYWLECDICYVFLPCLDFICQPDCVQISSRGWQFHLCCGRKFR